MSEERKATLRALLARVEAEIGPNRQLDAAIARFYLPAGAASITRQGDGWHYRLFGPDGWEEEWVAILRYTALTDDAATTRPHGWQWITGSAGSATVYRNAMPNAPRCTGEGATAALALLSAGMRAMLLEMEGGAA